MRLARIVPLAPLLSSFLLSPGVAISADPPKAPAKPTREIVVSVVDGNGRPIAGARVGLSVGFSAANSMGRPERERSTGSDGKATLRMPTRGPLQCLYAVKKGAGLDYVNFSKRGRRPRDPGRPEPRGTAPDVPQSIRFVLDGVHTMRLHVVDERRRPLAGIPVRAMAIERPNKGGPFPLVLEEAESTTDAVGAAQLDVIPREAVPPVVFTTTTPDYYFHEWPNFDAAAPSSELTFIATRMPALHVHVSLPDGKPAAEADLYSSYRGIRNAQAGRFDGSCDADGNRIFHSPLTDSYRTLSVVSGHSASPLIARALRIGRGARPIDLVLQPAARVHGTFTFGKERRPIPDQPFTLVQLDDDNYSKLPEEERWLDLHEPIFADVYRGRNTTDAEGRFEFYAAPGHYKITTQHFSPLRIIGPDLEYHYAERLERTADFEVQDQKPVEFNWHRELPLSTEIAGRVVRKSAPNDGVANAIVHTIPTVPEESRFGRIATDSQGSFHSKGEPCNMLMQAQSNDGSAGGIVRVAAADTRVVIPVEPTGSARGRFLNEVDAKPAGNRLFLYGVRVDYPGYGFRLAFESRGKTNRQGEFTIRGLVPGWKYAIYAQRTAPNGRPIGLSAAGDVTAPGPQAVDLGDVKLSFPTPPPQPKSRNAK